MNWTTKPLYVIGIIGLGLIALGQGIAFDKGGANAKAVDAQVRAGKALWEEKCRTVAGEKIYRRVENVEGLLLMKVRPQAGEREWSDQMWPGAAFALEATGEGYIKTFLGYEHASNPEGRNDPVTPSNRGYVNTDRRPGGLPGYRWVEVIDEKDVKRYRYAGRYDEPWKTDSSYSKSYVRFNLDRTLSTLPSPRYGVTYEDHVIPEERALGVASSTIKVLDLKTNEVMGEMTRYAWSPGTPSRPNPSPWLTAYKCPGHAVGAGAATRKFVDQILIPAKEK